jgi:hypothetical protein
MAIIIEAPNEVYSVKNHNNFKLFLAGGITNCPDWQTYVINELKDVPDLTIYNPRRKNFPINDPKASEEQIMWEFNHLRDADIIIFWFSRGSLNPIVLYELGMWANSRDTIFILGIDPEYERKQDVIIQTQLARPGLPVFDSLDLVLEQLDYIVKALKGEETD